MLIKRLFLLCSIPAFVAGCAGFYDYQTPAPVYGNNTPIYANKPLPEQQSQAEQPQQQTKITEQATPKPTLQEEASETVVTTAPLKETNSIAPKILKPEQLPSGQSLLTPAQEQELSALQQPVVPELELEPESKPEPKPKRKVAPIVAVQPETIVEVPPPPPSSPIFQPLENFTSLSPVVGSLVLAANQDSEKGNVEAATTTLERASRIEPRNAALYYKLALLKLKSKPSQAEDLAKKSAQLAANDPSLKKHSWLLVAKARELQKNFQGAKEARERADKF
jgi:tetratricopeptide (TPR) repeat protein